MKAKDLKSDYKFGERRPYLEDRVFYVPIFYAHYERFVLPPFVEIFGNYHPILVEYCSGNGDWVAHQAEQHPERNWIAVEKRFDRVQKIWAKLKNRSLNNLMIVCGEAQSFTRHYLPSHSLEGAFIHFPDPWPKGRHAKKRLLQNPFINDMARVLKRGKEVVFVTDDFPYLTETISHFRKSSLFTPSLPLPHFIEESARYGTSWFESLWREKGKAIYTTKFRNDLADSD